MSRQKETYNDLIAKDVARAPSLIGTYEIKANWTGDANTLPAESSAVTLDVIRLRRLSSKLSGEFDYSWRERTPIRLATLVTDFETLEPVSGATVVIEIYDQEGNLWISESMVERLSGTGVYEWESNATIRDLVELDQLDEEVYLAYVTASYHGGPTTYDILEFHIDPPEGQPIELKTMLLVAMTGIVGILVSVWYIDRRRLSRKLHEYK